jgi:hypothetical protein
MCLNVNKRLLYDPIAPLNPPDTSLSQACTVALEKTEPKPMDEVRIREPTIVKKRRFDALEHS